MAVGFRLERPDGVLEAFDDASRSALVLKPNPFASDSLLPIGVFDSGGCPDPHHQCRSGQYTLLLDVTDTLNNQYYDTQHVWFDNKPITVTFHGIQGVPSCQDLHLNPGQPFIPPGAPCHVAWNVNLTGIAYDEFIDETNLFYPSDNFDLYSLVITKQTREFLQVPITFALDPLNPFHGSRAAASLDSDASLCPLAVWDVSPPRLFQGSRSMF